MVSTCLWRSPRSQLSICEVYEWLAEKYPEYQYTKHKIRDVLRHDSERERPRFMIANKHRLPGVPRRWAIQPEMEPEVRRLCGSLLERQTQVPETTGNIPPPIRYDKSNFAFAHSGSMPQPESASRAREVCPDQSCCKRRCVSHREPSTLNWKALSTSGNPPSVIWNDFQEREFEEAEETRELDRLEASEVRDTQESTARAATPVTSTRCSRTEERQPLRNGCLTLVSNTAAAGRNKTNFDVASRENSVPRQRPRGCFRRDPDSSRNRMLYTKAAIALRKGMVALGRVTIDGDSMRNLLPRSIANELGLSLYLGGTIRIRVENRSITTSQYCRLSIQVAGIETTINTCVVSGLSSLLLGREWIQEVRLLRDFENHTCYILGPLGDLKELPDPTPTTEADTNFVTGEYQGSPVVEELPTAAEAGKCEPGELASTYVPTDSAIGDETMSEDDVWEDSVSRQSSEEDLYSVDRILAEKQEDGRMYYLLLWNGYTEEESTWEPLHNIRDTLLLDIWRKRKGQELRGIVPAFDLARFEERRRETLGQALHK